MDGRGGLCLQEIAWARFGDAPRPIVTLNAVGASRNDRYIVAARRDGQPLRRRGRFAQVARGEHELNFRLSATPGTDWGTRPSSRPPSGG